MRHTQAYPACRYLVCCTPPLRRTFPLATDLDRLLQSDDRDSTSVAPDPCPATTIYSYRDPTDELLTRAYYRSPANSFREESPSAGQQYNHSAVSTPSCLLRAPRSRTCTQQRDLIDLVQSSSNYFHAALHTVTRISKIHRCGTNVARSNADLFELQSRNRSALSPKITSPATGNRHTARSHDTRTHAIDPLSRFLFP